MRKAALQAIESLLEQNESVVFIGSDLGQGTMAQAKSRHPKRVFMEGISEQHIVGFAAGLALEGFIPFVHTIGTFLTRRALEQMIVDVAMQNLPVKFIASGGGMVYAPLGPTHQSIDDFSLMRSIPNMVITAPADPVEMTSVIKQIATNKDPAYVRIAKGGEPDITSKLKKMEFGKIREFNSGSEIAILTTGVMLHECISAALELSGKGVNPAVFHIPFLSPFDEIELSNIAKRFEKLLVVEEHLPSGGLFSIVAENFLRTNTKSRVFHLSLPNEYASNYGNQKEHWGKAGIDSKSISDFISTKVVN
jgi:transketolase